MAEQNGVRNAAEGGNDGMGTMRVHFTILLESLDITLIWTDHLHTTNGLNLEEGGRPRGFKNQNVLRPPPARAGYDVLARMREVNENPGTLRLEGSARAEKEEEFPVLEKNAQNALPNPLRERLDAPHGDQEVPRNPEVFINQRAFEAAQGFHPRAADLPAQNEPLNFVPQKNPPLHNIQGNTPLNVPPSNRSKRVRGVKTCAKVL
jgi:hypothetical protein